MQATPRWTCVTVLSLLLNCARIVLRRLLSLDKLYVDNTQIASFSYTKVGGAGLEGKQCECCSKHTTCMGPAIVDSVSVYR